MKALSSSVRRHHRLLLKVRVTLSPQRKRESSSSATSTVAFRR